MNLSVYPKKRPRTLALIVWIAGVVILAGSMGAGVYWWKSYTIQAAATACQTALDEGRWDDARRWADLWTQRQPDDGSAWFARAEAARRQQDWTATEESLGRIPTTHRRFLRAQALRGDLALDALHDPFRAIAIWKDLLQTVPSSELGHQRLIYLYAMTLQRQAMVQQIRTAIKKRSEPPEAYGYLLAANALVFSDGYPRVSQWLRKQPDDETLRVAQAVFAARTNPSKGQRMFGVGDGLKANLQLIEKCRIDYPQNLEVLAYLIETAIAEGKFAAVGSLLEELPASADNDSRFWRYRGTWLDSQRRAPEAAEAFQKSIALHPMDWRSHHELGTIARILQQPDVAARHADLGQRGKQLERQILELPNAAQADEQLMRNVRRYAQECGDEDAVFGLSFRLNIR